MNSQPPGASSSTTTSITLAQWVPTFLRWYPLRHGVVVGASQQALQHLNAAPHALTVFKAHAPNAKANPQAANSFDWLIAAQNGPATLYQASLPSESGLLPPPALKGCWPGIQCVGQHELQARTLDAALQAALQTAHPQAAPNWLWVGSVPAAPVLAGATQLLQQAEVLAVRVTLHPEAAAHAGLETVQPLLAAQGLVLCGIEPERNPQLGTALFVRDHASAHAQTRQQLSASGQAQAQLQAKLQAESQALQAEAQAKNQAIPQRDALTKDNADLHAKLQAEMQGRQAEAASKAAMQQERDGLAQAQAQLQAKLDAESQALQAEAKAKIENIAKAEALTKDNAELQARLQAETQGRQAEGAAKAAMVQQRDELTQAQVELQNKLAAEVQAQHALHVQVQKIYAQKMTLEQDKETLIEQVKKIEQSLAEKIQISQQLAKIEKVTQDSEQRVKSELAKGLTNAVKQLESYMAIQEWTDSGSAAFDFHGWPISPDLGLFLIEKISNRGYDLIIEFGSGTSTALIAKAVSKRAAQFQVQTATNIVSFEHHSKYFEKTQQTLNQHGIDNGVQLTYAPLGVWREGDAEYMYYDCQESLDALRQLHKASTPNILLVIDGPPASTCPNARYPAVPIVFEALGRHCIDLVLDDASRSEEKKVIDMWRAYWKSNAIPVSETEVPSEKGIYFASVNG